LQLWTDLSLLELVPTRRREQGRGFVPQFLCVVAILATDLPQEELAKFSFKPEMRRVDNFKNPAIILATCCWKPATLLLSK
jgi:hypothetical protein